MKKVHIINKFGPKDNAITGRAAGDLGTYLMSQGQDVTFFCIKESYKQIGKINITSTVDFKIKNVRKLSFGNEGMRRMLTSMLDGFRLTIKSFFNRADVVIVMTDPPMLNFWSFIHRIKRRKIFYWTMDLYPDALHSAKVVNPSNPLSKFLKKCMYKHTPDALIALGEKQFQYIQNQYYSYNSKNKVEKVAILPCGIMSQAKQANKPDFISNEDEAKLKFCYAGNIGEAHDPNFLISFIKALDISKHVMYVNLYGNKADYVWNEIKDLPVIKKINYLSYDQMNFIDIHLVSLIKDWNHVCVPSKAVSAICSGSVLLQNNNVECDGWAMFKDACWNIEQVDGKDYSNEINNFLDSIDLQKILSKKQIAKHISLHLQSVQDKAYSDINNWIENN